MMKFIKILAFVGLYLSLSFSATSCMSVDSSSSVEGDLGISGMDSSGTYTFPVTIAKLIQPIDKDSLETVLTVSTEELTDGSITDPEEVIAIITGDTFDSSSTAIGVMVDEVYVESVVVEKGSFTYNLPYKHFGKPMRFFVLGDDATISNGGNVSEPVTITLATTTSLDGITTVIVTIEGPVVDSETGEVSTTTETRTETVANILDEGTSEDESSITENDVDENNATETAAEENQNQAPQASDITLNVGLDFMGRVYPNPVKSVPVDFSATDIDGDTLTYEIVTSPVNGTIEIIDDAIMYVPQIPFDGDSFTYVASDGLNNSNEATITVTNEPIANATPENQSFNSAGVVFNGKPGSFAEAHGPQAMTVAYDVNQDLFVGYFETKYAADDASCPNGYWQIGRATSTDGLNWTQDDNPILAPLPGTEYPCGLVHPGVVFDGVRWHLFFVMNKFGNNIAGSGNSIAGLGYSASQDGLIFTAPVKILDSNTVGFPSALLVHGKLMVYYYTNNGQTHYVDRMTSDDLGVTWSPNDIQGNMISTTGAWAQGTAFANAIMIRSHSAIYKANDAAAPYKMAIIAHNPNGILSDFNNPMYIGGLLESADGINWTLSDDLAIVPNPSWYWHHEILLNGNDYLLWHKTVENGKAVVNFSTTHSDWP